jgi:hypothetical protein
LKNTPKLHSIVASDLEFQEWRKLILSDKYQLLDIGRCFPSEKFEELFLERADEFN